MTYYLHVHAKNLLRKDLQHQLNLISFKENSNMFVYLLSKNQSKAVKTPISIKNTIGNVLLVDNMDLLGKTLIVLDWDKNYEEELYIE